MDFGYLRAIEAEAALALGVPPEPTGQAAKLGLVAVGSLAWQPVAGPIDPRASERGAGSLRYITPWQ
jgi:hypothetical protein